MGTITISSVDDQIATVIAAQALGQLKSNTVLANLISRDYDDAIAQHGSVVKVPVLGALTVNDKASGTVYTNQSPSDTGVSVTLNKHKEVSFLVEDLAQALARPNVMQGYMSSAITVLSEQVDADIAACWSLLSNSTIAATGSVGSGAGLNYTSFIEARRVLSIAKAPMAERFAVLHPTAAAEILQDSRFTNRDYQNGNESPLVRAGLTLGNLAGFTVIEDQNIVESAGPIQRNMFFNKNALVLVTRQLPAPLAGTGVISKVMSENGIGLRVQISYQHTLGGHLVTVDTLYGIAALRSNQGVVVNTD